MSAIWRYGVANRANTLDNKAIDCKEALVDLREQERELATQKLDNIINHYTYRADQLDRIVAQRESELTLAEAEGKEIQSNMYNDSIDATTKKLGELIEERTALQTEFASLIAEGLIEEESEEWYEYKGKLDDLDKQIVETKTDIIGLHDAANDVDLTKLGYQLDALTNSAQNMNDMMSLHTTQAIEETSSMYENLINNGMDQIDILEEQNKLLREQQKGLDPLSAKYQELESQIQDNISSITQMKTSQEGWNDSIIDLDIDKLEKYKESLTKTNDQYQRQKELQEALEELRKAQSQRTTRTYIEGTGFVYQADQEAIKDAQENLENVIEDQLLSKIDDLISALELQKENTNVYDANGNLLGTQYNLPQLGSLTEMLSSYYASNAVPDINGVRGMLYDQIVNGSSNKNMQFSFGDINLNEVNDVNTLGQAIVDLLPNAVLQAINK